MKLNDKTLAQYFDGELSEKATAEMKSLLESSPQNAQSLQTMENLSDLVQIMAEESATNVSFDGFDKRVLNEIHNQKTEASLTEKLGVWLREFFEHRKMVWIPTASVAGAACAALLAIGITSTSAVPPTMPTSSQPESWNASVGNPLRTSTVQIADAGEMDIKTYNIQNDIGQRIGVAWINE